MTINDPIADALTRIRNAKIVKHESVSMPASNLKEELIKVLQKEGYVEGYTVEEKDGTLTITFKESFLKGLDNGEHTVTVVNLDGDLEAKLTATGNVKTGDMSFIIVLVSTLALGAIVVTSKKRRLAK